MPLTLEMPATDLSNDPPWDTDRDPNTIEIENTAQAAADLLSQGEAEAEGEFRPTVTTPHACVPDLDCNSAGDCAFCGQAQSAPIHTDTEQTQPAGQVKNHSPDSMDASSTEARPADLKQEQSEPKKKRTRKAKADGSDKHVQLEAPPAVADRDQAATAAKLADISKSQSALQRRYEIATVETDYVRVCLQIQDGEDLIESTKGEVKHLREKSAALAQRLRSLKYDDEYQMSLPIVNSETPSATAVMGTLEALAFDDVRPSSETPPVPANFYPDAWKSSAVSELGLPPKLADKIAEDGLTTIGELEARRGEISQGRAKWPKGIGAAKITLIEDAVVKWLTENRDAATFAAANEVSQPAAMQPGHEAEQHTAAQSHDTPPAADLTDAQAAAAVTARAATLNDGSPSCLDRKHPDGDKYWQSGYEAYGRSVELTECPYDPVCGQAEYDDWLRGWMAARAVDGMPDAVGPEAKPSIIPAEQVSLDDL